MNEPVMDYMRRYRFKKLLLLDDADTELRAVIAIHSTALGPAGGGVRFWPYPSEKEAMVDAMRLARGMTYKYAAAGIDLGGGKAVIVGDPSKDKSEALLRAFGRMVDQLGGEYYLAEERHGTQLEERGICYAVDFVANSGGIVYDEEVVYPGLRKPQGGLRHDRAEKKVREIFGRIEEVFAIADREGVPCWRAAELLAERRIEAINRVRLLNTSGQVHHR
jgi:glutamate dehydrogenase/leucine dehydrogenase